MERIKEIWLSHRVALIIAACVVALATIGGIFLFFHNKNDNAGADSFPAVIHYNRSDVRGYNYLGYDSKWAVWIDLYYNDEVYSVYGIAECFSPGVWWQADGSYDFTASSDMVPDGNGNVTFTGTLPGGSAQTLEIIFTVNLNQPYQPVAKSQVSSVTRTIGDTTPFQDEFRVYEADKDGYQVTGQSSWLRQNGVYVGTNVTVNAYGPFASQQAKVPDVDSGGRFFGGTDGATMIEPTIDTSKIMIVGDSITYNSTSEIRAALGAMDPDDPDGNEINILTNNNNPRGFYSSPSGGDNGYTVLSNLPDDQIRDYVVYALGSYDPDSADHVEDVIDMIQRKRANAGNDPAKIIFVTAYNGTYPLTGSNGCWDYWATGTLDSNGNPVPQPTADPNINCSIRNFNVSFRESDGSLIDNTAIFGWWNIVDAAENQGTAQYLVENNNRGVNPTSAGRTAFASGLAETIYRLFPNNGAITFPSGNTGQWGAGNSGDTASGHTATATTSFSTGDNSAPPGQGGYGPYTVSFDGSTNWPAGHYYFVANINRENQYYVLEEWYSPFGETTEYIANQFQPYATSDVKMADVEEDDDVVDTITAHVTDDVSKANASVDNSSFDQYWPANAGLAVNICVDLFGPSQYPLDNTTSSTVPDEVSGSRIATMCYNFDHASQTVDFNFSEFARNPDDWINAGGQGQIYGGFTDGILDSPGYYYFQSYITSSTDGIGAQTQGVSELIISEWRAWFNPTNEKEWLQRKFQPIAESLMQGNRYSNDSGTNDRGANKGVVFDCEETQNMTISSGNKVNYGLGSATLNTLLQNNENLLTCRNLTDYVYLGATDSRDINDATNVITDNYVNETSWPKRADGNYVQVRYQVKLYGPFADPEGRIPTDGVGSTAQTVPYSGSDWQAPYDSQPVAMTDYEIATNGPKYNFLSDDYYEVVFKQDANGGTSGDLVTTDLKLAPGFYVSVVEILMDEQCDMSSACGNPDSYSPVGSKMMESDFYSAWGDAYESTSISQPVYAWSQRGDSDEVEYRIGDKISDTVWTIGFSNLYYTQDSPGGPTTTNTRTDALGKDMYTHGCKGCLNGQNFTGFAGKDGYFAADPQEDIEVTLYGPYDNRPTSSQCQVGDPVAGSWTIKSQDFNNLNGGSIRTPEYTLTKTGWYVYQVSYVGGDRVYPFQTGCDDLNEMIEVVKEPDEPPEEEEKPDGRLRTQVQTVSNTAPTVIWDDVTVTGTNIEQNSRAELSLYKSADGETISPANDGEALCTLIISSINGRGTYKTGEIINGNFASDYLNPDGTVKDGRGSGRCFAEEAGFYYWSESFMLPDGDNYPDSPNSGGPGEEIVIKPPEKPKTSTTADSTVMVGEPFKDTAHVTLYTTGKEYKLYFTAYGPQTADGSVPVCSVENILFTNKNNPQIVTVSGDYVSPVTSATTPGNVYWIETLVDIETGEEYTGECGKENEITRVNEEFPPPPPTVIPPEAGLIMRSVISIAAFGAITSFLIWQWTSPRSFLFKRITP